MTIFHVLQYKGHTTHVGEYPAWVMEKFRAWSRTGRQDRDQVHRYLDLLLAEYDPDIHGRELHTDRHLYILGDVTAENLHFVLSTLVMTEKTV